MDVNFIAEYHYRCPFW